MEQIVFYGKFADSNYQAAFGERKNFEQIIKESDEKTGLPADLVREQESCSLCSLFLNEEAEESFLDQLNTILKTDLCGTDIFEKIFPTSLIIGKSSIGSVEATVGKDKDVIYLIKDVHLEHVHILSYQGGKMSISPNCFHKNMFTGDKKFVFMGHDQTTDETTEMDCTITFRNLVWVNTELHGNLLPYMHRGERVELAQIDQEDKEAIKPYMLLYNQILQSASIVAETGTFMQQSLYRTVMEILLVHMDDIGVLDHPDFLAITYESIHRIKCYGEIFDYRNKNYRVHLLIGIKMSCELFKKWASKFLKVDSEDLTKTMTIIWNMIGECSYKRTYIVNTFVKSHCKYIIPNDEIYEIELVNNDYKLRTAAVRQRFNHSVIQYEMLDRYRRTNPDATALNMLVVDAGFSLGVFLDKTNLSVASTGDSRILVPGWMTRMNWDELSVNSKELAISCVDTHSKLRDLCKMDQKACVQFVEDQLRLCSGIPSTLTLGSERVSKIGLEMAEILDMSLEEAKEKLENAGPEILNLMAQLESVFSAMDISIHYLLGCLSAPIKAFVEAVRVDRYKVEKVHQYYNHLCYRTRYFVGTTGRFSTSYALSFIRLLMRQSFQDLANVMGASMEFTGMKFVLDRSLVTALRSCLALRSKEMMSETSKVKKGHTLSPSQNYDQLKAQVERLQKIEEENLAKKNRVPLQSEEKNSQKSLKDSEKKNQKKNPGPRKEQGSETTQASRSNSKDSNKKDNSRTSQPRGNSASSNRSKSSNGTQTDRGQQSSNNKVRAVPLKDHERTGPKKNYSGSRSQSRESNKGGRKKGTKSGMTTLRVSLEEKETLLSQREINRAGQQEFADWNLSS